MLSSQTNCCITFRARSLTVMLTGWKEILSRRLPRTISCPGSACRLSAGATPRFLDQRSVRGISIPPTRCSRKDAQPEGMSADRSNLNLNLSFREFLPPALASLETNGAGGGKQSLQDVPTIPLLDSYSFALVGVPGISLKPRTG